MGIRIASSVWQRSKNCIFIKLIGETRPYLLLFIIKMPLKEIKMKINKAFLCLVLGAMLLLLSGCFQVTEEYWVNTDGSGKMHFEVGVSEALLSMGESNPIDSSQIFSEQGLDSQNPYLKNIKTSENSADGMHFYVLDADITDFSKVSENGAESGFQIQVEKLANGNYLFKRTMDLATLNAAQADPSLDMGDENMADLVEAMFSDKYWVIRLHVNNVVNTNGTLDKEKQLVEWKVPLSQLMSGKETIEMTAEISMGPSISLYLLIGGGVLLLAIVGIVVWLFLKKRAQSKDQVPPPPPASIEPPSIDLPAQMT